MASSSSPSSNVGEQRHERGRQHAAEQQLVDDVRRLVAEAVGVGQRGLAEDVGEGDDAEQPGDARQRGARRRR